MPPRAVRLHLTFGRSTIDSNGNETCELIQFPAIIPKPRAAWLQGETTLIHQVKQIRLTQLLSEAGFDLYQVESFLTPPTTSTS